MNRLVLCWGVCVIVANGFAPGAARGATELTRGPYLQLVTPDSILVRWRTDLPSESLVRYGTQPGDLLWSAVDPNRTTEHEVRLTGLAAATAHFYSIGSLEETLAEGTACRFVTGPPPGGAGPTRVWVIADSGGFSHGCTNALRVRDAYREYTGTRQTDVWLVLGDNAYNSGTDAEYQADFFNVHSLMLRQTPPWSAIGNHDVYSVAAGQRFPYLDIFSFPTNAEAGGLASGTEKYYSFDHANIHFVCLDSMTENRATNGPMANWLRADLAATSNEWIIAFWHHPPYSKGSHDSDDLYEKEMVEMRENFLPILESAGVDLVLGGHSHIYERSYLLHGHYGSSGSLQAGMILDQGSGRESDTGPYIKPLAGPLANRGTVYVVAGNAASIEVAYGHHPAMFMEELSVGSLVLDITSHRLDAVFLRGTGTVGDSFTILKGEPEPLLLRTFNLQNGTLIARWRSLPGRSYRLERTDNIGASNWQLASDVVIATGATTSWTNAAPPGEGLSFYRVKDVTP